MNILQAGNIQSDLIPITRFNKGEAGKIFDEVNKKGVCVVVKNNKPACILVSPDRYELLLEHIEDKILLEEAEKRMANRNPNEDLSYEQVLDDLKIDESDLDEIDVDLDLGV